jgi:hypothetical protein
VKTAVAERPFKARAVVNADSQGVYQKTPRGEGYFLLKSCPVVDKRSLLRACICTQTITYKQLVATPELA